MNYRNCLALCRPGDWLRIAVALVLVVASYPLLWRGGPAVKAVILVFATAALIFGIVNGLITAAMLRETESVRKSPT